MLLHRRDRLHVDVEQDPDGSVRIDGQDLTGEDEVEYVVTIAAAAVPQLARALACAEADVLDRLTARGAEIVTEGESTWLTRHGVPHAVQHW